MHEKSLSHGHFLCKTHAGLLGMGGGDCVQKEAIERLFSGATCCRLKYAQPAFVCGMNT